MTVIGTIACGGGGGAGGCSFALPSTSSAPPPASTTASTDRKYLLERVDEAAVVQLYADAFRDLPLKDKTLVWHLYQAAIAGRDIYYDQSTPTTSRCATCSKPSSRTRPVSIPRPRDEITRYTKLFWINTGPYNNLTARKFVLQCTPEAFAAAAHAAETAGARVPAQERRDARSAPHASQARILRSQCRSDRHREDAAAGEGHPHGQRQQSVCRRDDEGSRRLRRAVPAELASGEDEREAGRRGLPRRRPLRQTDRGDRAAPRGGDSRTRPSRWRRRCGR